MCPAEKSHSQVLLQIKAATFHRFDHPGMGRSYWIVALENLKRMTKLKWHVLFVLSCCSFFLHGMSMYRLELRQPFHDFILTWRLETTRRHSTVEKHMVPGPIDQTLELMHQVLEYLPPDWSCYLEITSLSCLIHFFKYLLLMTRTVSNKNRIIVVSLVSIHWF